MYTYVINSLAVPLQKMACRSQLDLGGVANSYSTAKLLVFGKFGRGIAGIESGTNL